MCTGLKNEAVGTAMEEGGTGTGKKKEWTV
jgi:hypothetical protein